ncbi:disulfide bond formation protein B [Paludibacterium yongneupense]|uniref:disulfide bond formation protein B n=1 Tax=Paludibacterium yongneupense TaxID=400061 RepID=UPI00041FA0F9|nr:disulfide bond formation protein B [Paludibacterium yongneupense]
MRFPSRRQGYFLIAAACAGAMGAALYLQHVQGLEPCPLCIFQRVGVIMVGLLALLAALLNPARGAAKVADGLIVLAALAGGSVSLRQLWLQSLPADQVPSCGPGLEYMLGAFPLHDVVVNVFKGSGECAVVDWTFLGMALPFWVLMFFIAVIAFVLLQMRRLR